MPSTPDHSAGESYVISKAAAISRSKKKKKGARTSTFDWGLSPKSEDTQDLPTVSSPLSLAIVDTVPAPQWDIATADEERPPPEHPEERAEPAIDLFSADPDDPGQLYTESIDTHAITGAPEASALTNNVPAPLLGLEDIEDEPEPGGALPDFDTTVTAAPTTEERARRDSSQKAPLPSPPSYENRRHSGHITAPYKPVEQSGTAAHARRRRSPSVIHHRLGSLAVEDPPPPHHPQAHFYAAPLLEPVQMHRRVRGSSPAESQIFYAFDTLAGAGNDASEETENVFLVGGDGVLDVYRLEKEKLSVIGHMRGLRGQVVGARILPRLARSDALHDRRPLVVLTIHGPTQLSTRNVAMAAPLAGSERLAAENTARAQTSPRMLPQSREGDGGSTASVAYQTTVEVFSLKTRELIASLYTSPSVMVHPARLLPPTSPIGSPRVEVNAKYIVIGSGSSGEVWIFGSGNDQASMQDRHHAFRCLAKVWTAVQPNISSHSAPASPPEGPLPSGGFSSTEPPSGKPVYSLSHRWLAYVPAKPSSHPPLGDDSLIVKAHAKAPGVFSHTAPPQPQANCAVDTPDGDGLLNRVAREATQELIRGARWLGDQGMQAWRSIWSRPTQAEHNAGLDAAYQGREPLHHIYPSGHVFPPTHAHPNYNLPSGREPVLVSILDLARLDKSSDTTTQRLNPIATFQAPLGCSHLSFAPGGLHLLTASQKGDVQFVWDLMRVTQDRLAQALPASSSRHSVGSPAARQGPLVRQVQRFSRMTATNIVDVVWTTPIGGRLAIVTERGTVHMFDMPPSAFQWPPPRRTLRKSSGTAPDEKDVSRGNSLAAATGAASHTVSAAVKMVNNTAQPLLAVARGRRSSSGAGVLGGGAAATGVMTQSRSVQSGRMVAQGLSRSLDAASETLNIIRSIGENRLHTPKSSSLPFPGCVKWLAGRESGLIGIAGDGIVKVYEVRAKTATSKSGKRQSLASGRQIEHAVANPAKRALSPAQMSPPQAPVDAESRASTVAGFWHLRPRSGGSRGGIYDRQHPLSHAEIETNAPYQPFHTDKRVGLFVYDEPQQPGSEGSADNGAAPDAEAWVFGQAIPMTRIPLAGYSFANERQGLLDQEGGGGGMFTGPVESVLHHRGRDADDETEQLVLTTRRRRRARGADGLGEDGFFEDDCEVLDFASDRV